MSGNASLVEELLTTTTTQGPPPAAATVDSFTLQDTLFYTGCGTVGGVLNGLVLIIAFTRIDTDDKPRQLIVMNMTFADFVMCLVYMITRPFLQRFPLPLCHPYYVAIWTAQLVSCLNLLWLNVDKLLFVQWPLHYNRLVTRRRLLIVSTGTWLGMGATALAVATVMTIGDRCTATQLDPYVYLSMTMLYIVFITGSFLISIAIYAIAHTTTRAEKHQRRKLLKRLFFLFTSTLWTFFSCIPYRAFFLIVRLCSSCDPSISYMLTDVFFRLLVVGIMLNPLITIFTQRIYRDRFLAMLQMIGLYRPRRKASSLHAYSGVISEEKRRSTAECSPLAVNL